MLNNQVEPQPLMCVTENSDILSMGLHCLVAHFICVIKNAEQDNTLLTPLLALAEGHQPVKVRCYLLTLLTNYIAYYILICSSYSS